MCAAQHHVFVATIKFLVRTRDVYVPMSNIHLLV
eukprot:SAG31_NODE_25024_length_469_cov_1.254054_1_plen_33_part_10